MFQVQMIQEVLGRCQGLHDPFRVEVLKGCVPPLRACLPQGLFKRRPVLDDHLPTPIHVCCGVRPLLIGQENALFPDSQIRQFRLHGSDPAIEGYDLLSEHALLSLYQIPELVLIHPEMEEHRDDLRLQLVRSEAVARTDVRPLLHVMPASVVSVAFLAVSSIV